MNFYYMGLICLGVASIRCAPVENGVTFYDAIAQKCPSVTSLPNFKDQYLFKSCNNWKEINEVENLSDVNKKEVLCWLYFNAFTQYCNHTQQVNISLPPPNIAKSDLSEVCDKMEVIPKELDLTNSLHNIIKTADDCKKLCSDEVGWVESLCSISYYYNLQSFGQIAPQLRPIFSQDQQTNNLQNNSIKSPGHFISVPQHADQQNHGVVNQQVLTKPEKAHLETVVDDQKIKQTTEDTNDNFNQNIGKVGNNTAQSKIKVDHNNDKKKEALPTPIQPLPVKSEEEAINGGEPSLAKDINGDAGNSAASFNKDKKQDPDKGNDVDNAPAPPPLVDHNIEVPGDKPPVENDDEPDMGPNEEVMQPNDRLESEEDIIQEQADIMPHEKPKPGETEAVNYTTEMDGDSYFFTYFMLLCIIFIVGYVCYHNKQKILALILEGRRGKRQYRGRRPNSANYHKLDSNLEEAITSSCNKNTNNVIY